MVHLGIPKPDGWVYRDYTTIVGKEIGGERKHGPPNIALSWSRMTLQQIARLKVILGTETYFTIHRNDGENGSIGDWVDVRGRAGFPQFTPSPKNEANISNVTLEIKNITLVNVPTNLYDPDTFSSAVFNDASNSQYVVLLF